MALAVAATLAQPRVAAACAPEAPETLPTVAELRASATVIVLGTVAATDNAGSFTVNVDRILKGSAGTPSFFDQNSTCVLVPNGADLGARVVVAGAADGTLIGAWIIRADGSAYAWLPSTPDLVTEAQVLAALGGPPDTATVDSSSAVAQPAAGGAPALAGLTAFLWALAAFPRREAGCRRTVP
jgi:hypothetical protein